MISNKESLYWKKDERWYRKNKDGKYELTEEAPQRAKESFALYNMPRSARIGKYKPG